MSGKGDYKTISRVADSIQALSVFVFIIAMFPVLAVVTAFVKDAQETTKFGEATQVFPKRELNILSVS